MHGDLSLALIRCIKGAGPGGPSYSATPPKSLKEDKGMDRALSRRTVHALHPWRAVRCLRAATMALLFLSATLGPASAANVLMNPGFEDGATGWDTNTWGTGPGELSTTMAHSGTRSWKWNGTGAFPTDWQGGRQLSVPVSDSKFYQYSAWVNVPTANEGDGKFGWSFRHNIGAGAEDLGYTLITAPGWTQVKAPIIRPPLGTTALSYVGFHSTNFGGQTPFYVDDVAVEELDAYTLNGRVVTSGGAGVSGATVSAISNAYATPTTTTDGGGYYSFTVPAGTYTINASAPGLKGSTLKEVSSSPTTAGDIVLETDPDYDADLVFSAYSSNVPASGPWPATMPAGTVLTPIGAPGVETVNGIKWAQNLETAPQNGPGWRFGSEVLDPIPALGASAVAVVKLAPARSASNNWDSVIDVFYDRLVLGVRNDSGLLNVRVNGSLRFAPEDTALAASQAAVISLIVQLDGTYKAYINGEEVLAVDDPSDMSTLTPGVEPFKHYINVGRNDPDGWTNFNGYIGDVFLYKTALSEAKHAALVERLLQKFNIDTTVYTIQASVNGVGGRINPSGAFGVPAGMDATFTITPDSLYRIDRVIVDGVDKGPISSYTFKDVRSNDHTIVASFALMPNRIVTGKVTGGGQGIYGARVNFKSTSGANQNPEYSTQTTTYDGDYQIRVPLGTYYVNATADAFTSPADNVLIVTSAPTTQNIALIPMVSSLQPMLVDKGSGAARTNISGTVGYAFTTGPFTIEVSSLGFVDWDRNGLVEDHEVGIWQDGDMIVGASVPMGTAGTLVGDYRYVAITPAVRLLPNTTYVIGAVVNADGDAWPDFAPNPGFNQPDFAGITNVRGRMVEPDPFLTEPTADRGTGVCAAPNLIGKMVMPATVKGVVKNASGVGINSAVLQIGGMGGLATVTDKNGQFELRNVPLNASIELFADAVGYAAHTENINTTSAETTPVVKNITLTAKVEGGVGQNLDFESGTTAGWTISGEQPGDLLSVVSPGFSGNFAGRFTPGADNSWTWMRQIIPIIPGSTYTVTFKTYADPSVPEFFPMIAFRDDDGGEMKGWISAEPGFEGWAHVPPRTWKQYMLFQTYSGDSARPFIRIAPPEGATYIDVWVGATGIPWNGGSAYLDDVVIDRIGPDVPNPPFVLADVVNALRYSGGLVALPDGFLPRYDVTANGQVDLGDAMRILRKVMALDTNP